MQQLKEYWILKIQDVYEFQEIAKTEQPEIDLLQSKVDSFFDETLVKKATDVGLSRYERMLGLVKHSDHEVRVNNILLSLTSNFPLTLKYLKKLLANALGKDCFKVEVEGYNFKLSVNSAKEKLLNLYRAELRRKIPANMTLDVSLIKNVSDTIYIGTYVRNASSITIRYNSLEQNTAIVGKAIVGKAIVGKE